LQAAAQGEEQQQSRFHGQMDQAQAGLGQGVGGGLAVLLQGDDAQEGVGRRVPMLQT
jgi:hypothetical protein